MWPGLDDAVEGFARRLLRRPRRVDATDRAGAVTRVLAMALDAAALNRGFLALSALIAFLIRTFSGGGHADDVAIVVGAGFWAAAGSAYRLLFWALAGQTPGMRFFGIRLLRGGAAGGIGARRLVGMVLAAIPLGLGFIGVLRAADRRGFHDRLAGTEVACVPDVARAPWSILPADAVSAE